MAELYKVLGQLECPATTLTTLYTVPAATTAVLSTLVVCNRGATRTYRVSIQVGGAADTLKQYIYYDNSVAGTSTNTATLGITVGAGDIVKVYANNTGLSFSLFGCQIT